MSGPEGLEKPLIQKIMHLSFEDGTPDEVILNVARQIADHLLIDPQVVERSPMGTIELFDIVFTGVRDLEPKSRLTGEELRLRELTLRHFESLE